MKTLKALGCKFALDDFGSGLSSFTYLKNLPVDYLKIDGSFVKNLSSEPVNSAMVESINQIGHIMGLQTIAEFAEDEEAIIWLNAMNVDFAQGFVIHEPEPLIAREIISFPETAQARAWSSVWQRAIFSLRVVTVTPAASPGDSLDWAG